MTKRRQFGTTRPLPSGRWQARYRDATGQLVPAPHTFRTKTDADRWLASVQTDQARGSWVDPRLGRLSLSDWIEQWWETTTNLRPSTRARDRMYVDRYVLPTFGDVPLARLEQLAVRSWVTELSARGLAPATVQKAYQLLGKVMSAAVDAGLIAASPCRRVPLPRVEREEMRFLTPAEVATLADAIHPRYRALVLLGAYGGLRIGELAGLKPARVDVLRARLDVAEILVEVNGHITQGSPKTKAGRRTVSIPRPVAEELGEHLARWSGEYVFTSPSGGPLRVPGWRQRFWRPAVRDAGLHPLRPHDLRHTAVTFWIAEGANPKQVATRAGHTSVSFTLDRYGHLFPEADDELMERLEAAYTAASEGSKGSKVARRWHADVAPIWTTTLA